MHGLVTDSKTPGGLRLADDLPERDPANNELVLGIRAFSVNAGEVSLIEQRPDGWRPGQDTSGVVVREAADGTGPPAGTRVVAYPSGTPALSASRCPPTGLRPCPARCRSSRRPRFPSPG